MIGSENESDVIEETPIDSAVAPEGKLPLRFVTCCLYPWPWPFHQSVHGAAAMKHAVPESPLPPQYADGIYHEEQRLFKCGKHALNNLLGAEVFHKDQLDGIAQLNLARSGLGPSLFGTLVPNYWDANVIQMALFEQGYACDYFDKRRPVCELELGPDGGQDGGTPAGDAPIGLVLNVVTSRCLGIMRHWRAIRRLAPDLYANVDSRLARPQVLTTEELRTHLDTMSRNGNDCTVLVVKKIPELSRE